MLEKRGFDQCGFDTKSSLIEYNFSQATIMIERSFYPVYVDSFYFHEIFFNL